MGIEILKKLRAKLASRVKWSAQGYYEDDADYRARTSQHELIEMLISDIDEVISEVEP